MRKTAITFIALLLSLFSVYADQIKLLTIGNSFSDDAVEHYLYGLVEANGDTIIIGNMYIGGCSLERHYDNSQNNSNAYSYRKIVNGEKTVTPDFRLTDAITDENWDYISFQQVSGLSGIYESYFPFLDELIKFAKEYSTNSDVQFVVHSTWAYAKDSTHPDFANYNTNQEEMYSAIIDAGTRAAERAGIKIIIPAGTAIQNGRPSSLEDTFCRDGYHLELTYGRYTASCAWYEKLFGKTVVGNSYVPDSIDPYQAKIAQRAAHNAVYNPTSVTPVWIDVDLLPEADYSAVTNKHMAVSLTFREDDAEQAMNFHVDIFDDAEEIEDIFTKLAEGGQVAKPLDNYGFSNKFA